MKLKDITEEQKALAIKVAEEWKGKEGNIRINKEEVTEGLEYLYSTINKPLPKIIWVSSPLAMQSTYQAIKGSTGDRIYPSYVLDSIMVSVWMARIDYYQRIGIKHGKEKEVAKILKLQSAYEYIFCENVVIVCEHPMYPPKWNGEGRKHCEGSPAMEWEDGYKLWYLNGVRVPQYLAETPAGKLDLDWYLREKDADVRAQFILKYGIDRMSELGKVIDSYRNYEEINEYWKKSEYELIDMASIHENMEKALYLKMKNQTVDGFYHLEGVSNDCNTIYDAIKCRWNGIDPSQYVTINIK